jgi:hypothetical protein
MWYKVRPDSDKYDYVSLANRDDLSAYLEMVTQHYRFRVNIPWHRFAARVNSLNNPGDFPGFIAGSDLVLTQKSWEVLKHLIKRDVKLTILRTETEDFFWLKIMSVIDALDYEKAKYHSRTAEMIGIESYVFREELIAGKHIFYQPRANETIVSQTFKDTVERFELRGLIFKKLC